MSLAFYDLDHDPFSLKPEEPLLYVPPGHTAAVTHLMDAIAARRGFMALLGEAGMGKTTLMRVHLAEVDPQQLRVIYLPQADVSFETLVQHLYDEFGCGLPAANLPEMLARLHALIIAEHKKGRNIALVIDNAHLLPFETLRDLSLLSNIALYPEKLLQIVLVALPHLEQLFDFLDLIKVGNPFTTVAYLQRLSYAESVCYIQTHIAKAQKHPAPVLSKGAIRTIATAAQGLPQRIRRMCSEVLAAGWRAQVRPVPQTVARRVIAVCTGCFPRPWLRRILVSAASIVLLAAGLVASGQRRAVFDAATETSGLVAHVAPAGGSIEPVRSLPQEPAVPAAPVVSQEPVQVASEALRPAEAATPFAPLAVERVSVPVRSLPPAPSVMTRGVSGAVESRAIAVQQTASFLRRSFPNGGDFRLKVWTEKSGSTAYNAGEQLIVHVVAETTAYLWVDYYQADGQVVHLLPNPLETNRVVAGQTFSLGQPQSSFRFNIMPPFGAEMLMVIASQRSFAPLRGTANIEPAAVYVPRLQQNLDAARSESKMAVAYLDLLTQKQ